MRRWTLSVVAVLCLESCRHQPLTWRLTGEGGATVLLPPKTELHSAKPLPPVEIKTARQNASAGCDIKQEVVSLAWRGKKAVLRVAPPSTLVDAQGQPLVNTVRGFEAFRAALATTADRRCLKPDEGERLIRSALERAPLPPRAVSVLRSGGYAENGFIELTPEFHLEVISPDGGTFEVAQYEISPMAGDGVRLTLAGVSDGRVRSVSQEWLTFPDSARYFRLLLLIARSAADHDAMLVGAESRDALRRATAAIQARPGESCGTMPDYVCVSVPPKTAVNPQIRVRVNGRDAYVAAGAALRELQRAQIPVATLRVKRSFEGRPTPVEFDPNSSAILNLALLPGDEITW